MTFLEIFRNMKNNPSLFFKVFDHFKILFFEETLEYDFNPILDVRLSPDLKAVGFFRYYSEDACDMIASMGFFDLKLVVKDDDFFIRGDMSAVEFYHFLVRLLKFEVLQCK